MVFQVEVVESGLGWGGVVQALIEDGGSTNSETGVLADGETRCEEGICLDWIVELELRVGNNLASTTILISQNTAFDSDDGSRSTDGFHLSLSNVSSGNGKEGGD